MIGPPDRLGFVRKIHICRECYDTLEDYFCEPGENDIDENSNVVDK
jgi:hypothetical protein